MSRLLTYIKRRPSFWGFIVLPLGMLAIYLFVFASDRFRSETKFYIRSNESSADFNVGALAGLLQGQGAISTQEAEVMREFLLSAAMLAELDGKLHLRQAWSASDVDFISRLDDHAFDEEFLEFYRSKLDIAIAPSGIVTLAYTDFDAQRAREVVSFLIERGEKFINDISRGLANEQVEFIQGQVSVAEQRLREARTSLIHLQNERSWFDPQTESVTVLENIRMMEAKLAEEKARLGQLQSYLAADSAQIRTAISRIEALENQIRKENARLVGGKSALNEELMDFQSRKLDAEFAERAFASAYTSLEAARVESATQLKHLVVIESPTLANDALGLRKGYVLGTATLLLLMAYGIGSAVLTIVREHV